MLIITDNVNDAQKWAAVNHIEPNFTIKRADFLQYVKTPVTPVLFRFKNGAAANYTFFSPN